MDIMFFMNLFLLYVFRLKLVLISIQLKMKKIDIFLRKIFLKIIISKVDIMKKIVSDAVLGPQSQESLMHELIEGLHINDETNNQNKFIQETKEVLEYFVNNITEVHKWIM